MSSLDPSHFPNSSLKERKMLDQAPLHPERAGHAGSNSHLHIPAIPDLRFEHSYLRSIAPYVQTRRVTLGHASEKPVSTVHDSNGFLEVAGIDWRKVAWITIRDQLISPLLQGAIWGIASNFIRPFFSYLGTIFVPRTPTKAALPRSLPKSDDFTQRMRNWGKDLSSDGMETNIALSR